MIDKLSPQQRGHPWQGYKTRDDHVAWLV